MYFTLLLTTHVLLCLILMGLVLLQQGKGADAGATFGGGASSNSFFGAGGATDFITKLTTALAVLFMATSIMLVRAYQHGEGFQLGTVSDPLESSVMQEAQEEAPALPEEVAMDEPLDGVGAEVEKVVPEAAVVTEPEAVEKPNAAADPAPAEQEEEGAPEEPEEK